MPDIEREVRRLLREDNHAIDVKWEVIVENDKTDDSDAKVYNLLSPHLTLLSIPYVMLLHVCLFSSRSSPKVRRHEWLQLVGKFHWTSRVWKTVFVSVHVLIILQSRELKCCCCYCFSGARRFIRGD